MTSLSFINVLPFYCFGMFRYILLDECNGLFRLKGTKQMSFILVPFLKVRAKDYRTILKEPMKVFIKLYFDLSLNKRNT